MGQQAARARAKGSIKHARPEAGGLPGCRESSRRGNASVGAAGCRSQTSTHVFTWKAMQEEIRPQNLEFDSLIDK